MSDTLAQQLFGTPVTMARCVLLMVIALLLAAAASDLSRQRIPNRLVWSGTLLAILCHTLLPAGNGFLSALPGGLGTSGVLKGFGLTLLGLLPFYFLRLFGAGDVKLLAMIGAFVGISEAAWIVLFSALAGGLLTVGLAMHRRIFPALIKNLRGLIWHTLVSAGTGSNVHSNCHFISTYPVPYGVAIAAGSIAFLLIRAGQSGLLNIT